jgi:hypothetical protein
MFEYIMALAAAADVGVLLTANATDTSYEMAAKCGGSHQLQVCSRPKCN